MATIRRRHASQAGFSLVELLITTAILGIVMAAVIGVYMVAQRATLSATAAEDAQSVSRSTLERLLTDLRLINAGRGAPSGAGAITAASATSITFLGDIDNDTLDALTGNDATLTAAATAGDTTVQVSSATGFSVGEWFSVANGATSETQAITDIAGTTLTLQAPGLSNPYPVGSIVRSVETVSYVFDPATATLCRTVGGACPPPPFPDPLVLAAGLTGFQLTYWDGSLPPIQIINPANQASRDQIREIRITLTSRALMGDQTVSRTMTSTVRPRNF